MLWGFLGLVALVIVAVLLFAVSVYNKLIRLKNMADEGWSGIDVQLKRRYDLIPNIVETVKGYAKHEQQTFEKIVALRNTAMNETSAEKKGEAENQISQSLKSIFALAEAYPDLKANQNFQQLQQNLNEIEDAIQNSRRYYNGTVRELNTSIQTFPSNIFAGIFGVKAREFFEAGADEKSNVKVQF